MDMICLAVSAGLLVYLFVAQLITLKPLGRYMADVFEGRAVWATRILGPVERLLYRACGIEPEASMTWSVYAKSFLWFNALGLAVVYALLRLQHMPPGNPAGRRPWAASSRCWV
jgi:K+-transporting ATPase ATPase A chain